MSLKLILIVSFTPLILSTPIINNESNKVGCVVCHPVDDKKLNVHLIPHSHDDVGWLKTVDQYYYGMNSEIQRAGVQYIITSVFEALLENPDRRFVQVETAFFWQWWKNQDDQVRDKYKSLVDNGQIEMANGAWSMNDEACSNYQSTIDQFTWGLRTLDMTLGKCGRPRVGWQIDPFGHSREQASLLAQMGFDAMIFSRLDFNDKENRKKRKTMDFAWKGSQNLENSVIFGSTFATDIYYSPNGFCCDNNCDDDSIDDDPESAFYNADKIVNEFTNLLKTYSDYYPSNNVMIPMGGDFQYEAAEKNYANMDKLIKAFKNHSELNVIYSTPSCYIKAVHDSLKTNLTLKTDDFFPYSSDTVSFWTGYFSSRPNSKRFERIGHNILQATKQIHSQTTIMNNVDYHKKLGYLKETMGVMQHHDAITGTEKQHVANDYVRRLTKGIQHAEDEIGSVIDELLNNTLNLDLKSCLLSNISICTTSQNSEQFVVVAYNPLAWEVTHYLRLPVDEGVYEVNDKEVDCDVIPTIRDFSYVNLTEGTPSGYELVFAASKLPPMGIKIYHIKRVSNKKLQLRDKDFKSVFDIDKNTNLLKSVTFNGKTYGIKQNFEYYAGESGAYLFTPFWSGLFENVEITRYYSGEVVDEVHQKWNEKLVDIHQVIRWYHEEEYLEFDWIVGIKNTTENPLFGEGGVEVVSKFTVTDEFDNLNVSYTDSNGREMIKRLKDKREDYDYDPTLEPIAGNYYPVTSKIVIKDELNNVEVAVLTDRSQGGASLEKNQIELMVHRRLVLDDGKGVGEALNETEFNKGIFVRGSHYLMIGSIDNATNGKSTAAKERILAQKKLLQPWIGVAPINQTYESLKSTYTLIYQGLENSLPENVNILSFEHWHPYTDTFLIRFEHILEKYEDSDLSKEVKIDINSIFKHFNVIEVTEVTLGANELYEDFMRRSKYQWTENSSFIPQNLMGDDYLITLKPMQIRTFIIRLERKKTDDGNNNAIKSSCSIKLLIVSILFAIFNKYN